jgi:uncharacterized protein with von Willebrand factor type A (vWA) domain
MSRPPVRATRVIETDPWDRRGHDRAIKGNRKYASARRRLTKRTKAAPDALADVFMGLVKASPRLLAMSDVAPSHLVNRLVLSEMLRLTSTRRLRGHTVGDPVQATLGCVSLAPLLESIFERLALEQESANQVQIQLMALARLEGQVADAEEAFDRALGDGSDEEIEAALAAADAVRDARRSAQSASEELDRQMQALIERLESGAGQVSADLHRALGEMADQLQDREATARAWGISPGELHLLSADERLKLAKTLNSERLREIASLFGRVRNLARSDADLAPEGPQDEIVDLELGGDLGRVVASEWLKLGDPVTEMDFFARLADHELLQYAVAGRDELGRGGIIMCVDGSGSMRGAAELWSKAVMLHLLHEARAQRREMHVIHFSGPGQFVRLSFVEPGDFTAERLIGAAGTYFGGGTDFQTPMAEALAVLADEFARTGRTRADVVFATDDECEVRDEFMDYYLSEMKRLGARTYGLAMNGCTPCTDGPLATMSAGRMATVTDLRSGRDVRDMLRAVRA